MVGLPTPDDIAEFADSILDDAFDDYLPVYEVWWTANVRYAALPASQRLEIAERVVDLLISAGWARLSRAPWDNWEQQEVIPPEDDVAILRDGATWYPTDGTRVFLIPTEEDRTQLWRRQRGRRRADQQAPEGMTDRTASFVAGDRVRVIRDPDYGPGPWPDEPSGTVCEHPLAPAGQSWVPTTTRQGVSRTYWVRFDSPQRDTDGDGPYAESEVLDRYLLPEPRTLEGQGGGRFRTR